MANICALYNIYDQLLSFGFIKPMIVRHYNDEFILVHIFSDKDINICKIVQSKEDKTFTTLVTNFQKDNVECYEGDPVEFIIDLFIKSNGLDKLDTEALARVIDCTCNNMEINYMKAKDLYNIQCKSFTIMLDAENDIFKVSLSNKDYNSPIYKFKNGFDAFRFIYYIDYSHINQVSYNNITTPLLNLAMDLYLKFGNNITNQINTFPSNSIENTIIKLQSENGYMVFSINTLDGENAIECKIDRYDNKFFGKFKSNKYEDVLDFIEREFIIIK